MPPKKTTIEKELKKQNKEEAQNLVNMLEQQKGNVEDAVSSPSKKGRKTAASTSKKATASGQGKHDSKRPVKKEESGSSRSTEKANRVSKHPLEKLDSVSSLKTPEVKKSSNAGDSERSVEKEESGSKRSTEKGNRVSNRPSAKRPYEKHDLVSSSKKAKIEKPANGGAEFAKEDCVGKRMPKAAKVYRYEIDCQRVKESIDVHDFQRFFTMELKVNGEKDNLEGNVTISVDAHKLVISSKVYLPKRSLRYYAKKFLKKAGNIQVASKNKNSYEFKYAGTSRAQPKSSNLPSID